MRLRHVAISAAALAIFVGPPAARAFTFEAPSGSNSDGGARFSDPDERYERLADPRGNALGESENSDAGVSLSVRRPDPSGISGRAPYRSDPSNRFGSSRPDNQHLFWDNTTRYK